MKSMREISGTRIAWRAGRDNLFFAWIGNTVMPLVAIGGSRANILSAAQVAALPDDLPDEIKNDIQHYAENYMANATGVVDVDVWLPERPEWL